MKNNVTSLTAQGTAGKRSLLEATEDDDDVNGDCKAGADVMAGDGEAGAGTPGGEWSKAKASGWQTNPAQCSNRMRDLISAGVR